MFRTPLCQQLASHNGAAGQIARAHVLPPLRRRHVSGATTCRHLSRVTMCHHLSRVPTCRHLSRVTTCRHLSRDAKDPCYLETVQDMFRTPLCQQHASHTLASRAHGPQPHLRSSCATGPHIYLPYCWCMDPTHTCGVPLRRCGVPRATNGLVLTAVCALQAWGDPESGLSFSFVTNTFGAVRDPSRSRHAPAKRLARVTCDAAFLALPPPSRQRLE